MSSYLFRLLPPPGTYKALYEKFRARLRDKRNSRVGWSDIFAGLTPDEVQQMFVTIGAKRRRVCQVTKCPIYPQTVAKLPNAPRNASKNVINVKLSRLVIKNTRCPK
jgi:hypothetical protein